MKDFFSNESVQMEIIEKIRFLLFFGSVYLSNKSRLLLFTLLLWCAKNFLVWGDLKKVE